MECWSTTDYDWNPEAESGQTEPPADAGPFRSISAGGLHTCGVRTDGSVLCWGSDEFGQSTPPEGEFQSISAGGRHTCGIRINGSVRCWGENSDWEDRRDEKHLGATLRPTNTPLVPHKGDGQENRRFVGQGTPPEGAFRAVSAGWRHTCGIRVDGALACWGSPPLAPEQAMPPAGVFISVSVAYGHACAVREDNTVMCWGHRDYQHTDPPGYVAMSSNGVDYLCGEQSDGARVCRARNGAPDLPAPRISSPSPRVTNTPAGCWTPARQSAGAMCPRRHRVLLLQSATAASWTQLAGRSAGRIMSSSENTKPGPTKGLSGPLSGTGGGLWGS